MTNEDYYKDEEEFRDSITTVNADGSRNWIYAKKPSGLWHKRRQILAYTLLALLFLIPHIKIGGEQAILLNIVERKFIFFGKIFWPQDLYLLAITLLTLIIFVVLFTIIFGRLFCGWVCPQTIFMEMVFRKIEYWIEGDWTHQKKLNNGPWTKEKVFKKTAKHLIFWLISFLIANTFLAYIIGSDELWKIQTEPFNNHIGGLIALIIFSFAFYGVFAFLREQVCTTICPYGRLQGVLTDENTMQIGYDHVRGESRGKFKKNEDRSTSGKGDCIDCKQCVHVCPTGIDIRNGTQLECVNCTACIDACDHIMEGVGLEKGLIRFVSEKGIVDRTQFIWTKRVKAYVALLIVLITFMGVMMTIRNDFDTSILRQSGSTYQSLDDGRISNIFEVIFTNKTKRDYSITLKTSEPGVELVTATKTIELTSEKKKTERFIVKVNRSILKKGKTKIKVDIIANGKVIDHATIKVIGPII